MGSALAGSAEAIRKARRLRKLFGGGMRQAGILAAAALYALENHVDRLADDHAHARLLGRGVRRHRRLRTGIRARSRPTWSGSASIAPLGTAAEVAAYLRSHGILVSVLGPQVLRACTHLDVSREQVEYAAGVIREIEPAMVSAMTLVY